jgi:uncharacterized protein (TIGR00297 family)
MSPIVVQIIIGIAAAAAIAFVALRTRLLNPSGAWATLLLGSIVFGLGGLAWSLPLVAFFLPASLISKLGSKRVRGYREQLREVFEKGSTRDAGQVWANGGIAGAIVLLHALWPQPELFVAYLGALAAAAADTWGTEIGVMNRGPVISLRTLRTVKAGTSGGVSLVGTLGAMAGALSVAASGIWWTTSPADAVLVVTTAGITGMLADSFLGATAQAQYRCDICGMLTERTQHCTKPAILLRGNDRITNDVVNLACCLVGAVVAYLLSRSIG